MVISPSSSYPFRVPVVRYDVAVICKFLEADCALPFLLDDYSVQQFPHLGWRPQFPVSPGMGITYVLDTKLKSALFPSLLAPQQNSERWIGRYSFRRSFMGMLQCDLY